MECRAQSVLPPHEQTKGYAYVLFDRDAAWDNAGDHIVSWGSTVMNEADQLFDHLERLPKRPVAE